jgi:hypothetical protein
MFHHHHKTEYQQAKKKSKVLKDLDSILEKKEDHIDQFNN